MLLPTPFGNVSIITGILDLCVLSWILWIVHMCQSNSFIHSFIHLFIHLGVISSDERGRRAKTGPKAWRDWTYSYR